MGESPRVGVLTLCTPYALVKLRCCRSSVVLALLASVGRVCLACVRPLGPCPWDTERVSQRVRYVNPLGKLFFSLTAYHEIATLLSCP